MSVRRSVRACALFACVLAACTGGGASSGGGAADASAAGHDGGPGTVTLRPPDAALLGDGGADATVVPGIDAGPPPPAPPQDDARVVHVLVERAGKVFLARVTPDARYVGPLGAALPVAPADLDGVTLETWSRDEGPHAVIDLGDAGVYVGDGAAWRKLGAASVSSGMYMTQRFLAVSPSVDRVLLAYSAYDMLTFNYTLTGDLWSSAGDRVFPLTQLMGGNSASLAFDADGTRFTVREPLGIAVRNADDGSLEVATMLYQDVVALFPTSFLVGQSPYLNWVDFMGVSVTPPELQALSMIGMSWHASKVAGAWHTVVDDVLYRLGDRQITQVRPTRLAVSSVLGYADGGFLVGEMSEPATDAGPSTRAYVALDEADIEQQRFEPEASVVEVDDSIQNAEWERRARAKAWSITPARVAVAFEVQHTYWRGAWGQIAAVTDDLWVIDGEGAHTLRTVQVPYVPGARSPLVGQRRITADGRWYVWTDGDEVHAVSIDTLEAAALREAF